MKKYFKVCLNGYDEFYSCDEFQNIESLLEYFVSNRIWNGNTPVRKYEIEEIEDIEIKETDAYTENNAMMYIDCSNCNKSFKYSNKYDFEYSDILSEYEVNHRVMFECPECGQLHIITDIAEDPFRR